VVIAVQGGQKLQRVNYDLRGEISDRIWNLLASCWEIPENRPTVDRVLDVLATEREERTQWRREADPSPRPQVENDWPSAF
jgi:hypothetical protein